MAIIRTLSHEFVRAVPENPISGVLYVSMEYGSVVHLCCCGCGNEVVTPLTPKDWKLTYDGESISLHPSIGNWSFPCRSHYWVRNDCVVWAEDMDDKDILAGRNRDGRNDLEQPNPTQGSSVFQPCKKISLWKRILRLFD